MENQTNEQQQLKDALWKRATGYEVAEHEYIRGKNGVEKEKIRKRHVPPDLKAIAQVQRLMRLGQWE